MSRLPEGATHAGHIVSRCWCSVQWKDRPEWYESPVPVIVEPVQLELTFPGFREVAT